MNELRYTLHCDGSSDRALIPIVNWLLQQQGVMCSVQSEWADLRRLPQPPKILSHRLSIALDLYPCDLLFVHRDAERQDPQLRRNEIQNAITEIAEQNQILPPVVCVIPVRMHESWLLSDETAIRLAAGNPYGKHALQLPRMNEIERIPDPKALLYDLLRTASGLSGRHLRRWVAEPMRVADLTDDFSLLRQLPAFQSFEQELAEVVRDQHWDR